MTGASSDPQIVALVQQLAQHFAPESLAAATATSAFEDDAELHERAAEAATRLRRARSEHDDLVRRRGRAVRSRGGERVLGPYAERAGWRVVEIDAKGKRTTTVFATEKRAARYAEIVRAELAQDTHTTVTALIEYKRYLTVDKNDKQSSVDVTAWAINLFFIEDVPLALLSAKRCAKLYDDLRRRPSKRTGKPLAADTHRNILAQAKSFLGWCVERGWISENPAATVKGVGKRRPRGKSLGKSGNELRVKQARAWFRRALALANDGDAGATAALVALLLGLRASEIVSRRVADLDEEETPGDLLWIRCTKTTAGRRTLEVPKVLRPLLVAAAEGKSATRYLFECARPHERHLHKRHVRDWVIDQVHRICDLAEVPRVTAHAMRGLLATLTAQRGLAGHVIAATLGHEDERTTMTAYAAPGAAAAGTNRRGLQVLTGGAQSND